MTNKKRTKPKRAKPVMAWCIIYEGVVASWRITRERPQVFSSDPSVVRIARVEIREVPPKRRKRGGT